MVLLTRETYGFNAQTDEYVDMLQAGIVGQAKVVRAALQGAASVAGQHTARAFERQIRVAVRAYRLKARLNRMR